MSHCPALPPIGRRSSAPLPQIPGAHPAMASTPVSTGRKSSLKPTAGSFHAPTAAAAAKAPPRCPRVVHPVVTAAISQTVVLSACIPHETVSHRLLEYLVPHFIPAKKGVDVTALGTTRASQLLGDLSVSAAEFSTVVSHGTRVRGTLTITSPNHEDFRSLRRLCGSYLTSLQLHLRNNFHLSRNRSSSDRPSVKETQLLEQQALRESIAAFGQMRCLKNLTIRGGIYGGALDAAVACAVAVLPRLETLKMIIDGEFVCQNLFQLAVPNSLLSLTFGVTSSSYPRSNFEKPSFAFWRFFKKLRKLAIVHCSIGADFLEGAAAALTSLQSLDLSTSGLQPGCDNALSAFPEGLAEIRYGNVCGPEALAAYPHLTSVAVSGHGFQTMDPILAEGCNTTAAFKKRSQHRRFVREQAVRAALANLHLFNDLDDDGEGSDCDDKSKVQEWKPTRRDRGPPMMVDLSTGNKRIQSVSALQSLSAGSLTAPSLKSLGTKFRSLRSLKVNIECVGRSIDLTSWGSMRQLHTIDITGSGLSHIESLTTIAEQLHVLDATLRELTVPDGPVRFVIAVATHLPQLAQLRIVSGRVHAGITPTAQRAVLQNAGALRGPKKQQSSSAAENNDDDESPSLARDHDHHRTDVGRVHSRRGRTHHRGHNTHDSSSNSSFDSDSSDRDSSRSGNESEGSSDDEFHGVFDANDDDDDNDAVDAAERPELDEVPMEVAVSILGASASRPRQPSPPPRTRRRSTLTPIVSRPPVPSSVSQPPRSPPMLGLRQNGVVRLDAAATEKLFGQPRLLHTLIFDAAQVEIGAVPGLALLFPKLLSLECWGLTSTWSYQETEVAYTVQCLRPYWPQITLRKSPRFPKSPY